MNKYFRSHKLYPGKKRCLIKYHASLRKAIENYLNCCKMMKHYEKLCKNLNIQSVYRF